MTVEPCCIKYDGMICNNVIRRWNNKSVSLILIGSGITDYFHTKGRLVRKTGGIFGHRSLEVVRAVE
jgi:hypothetical protein